MDIVKVEKRNTTMSAKQLRRSGIIPCSVYGGRLEESLSIQMNLASAEKVFKNKRVGSTLYLELDGTKIPVQIKEKTRNPIGSQMEHVGFEALKADTRVNSVANIFLKNADMVPGQVEQILYEVPFSSLPKDMVDTVTIDLEGKPIGTDITVRDIPELQSDALKLKIDPDSMVVRIMEKRQAPAEEEEPQEE